MAQHSHSQTQTVNNKPTADFVIILESGSKWSLAQQMRTSRGKTPKQTNDC